MPTRTTSAGGSSSPSRNASNEDVPGGVLSCQGFARVPSPFADAFGFGVGFGFGFAVVVAFFFFFFAVVFFVAD